VVPPFHALAVGVGIDTEHKQSFSTMPSANATRPKSEGQASVTKRLKASSESKPRPGSIDSDVAWIFSDHNARANLFNNSQELTAKTLFFGSTGTHCRAVSLAWVSSTDNVNSLKVVFSALLNVSFSMNAWPMFFKHFCCVVIYLHLPLANHPCLFKTKIKSADSSK
jgi:hypothetical protein